MDKYTVISVPVTEQGDVELPSGSIPINAMYHPKTGELTIVAVLSADGPQTVTTRRIEEVADKDTESEQSGSEQSEPADNDDDETDNDRPSTIRIPKDDESDDED